jgi:gamma-glutamylcyclotransferase (GGCT)/AIG2-like uncharacterized protein YtfP
MSFELFVNGTLMRGLKLHTNLGDSEFLGEFRTAPYYRMHSINDVHPGMYCLDNGEEGGAAIAGELYLVETETWKTIEANEPANLYRGLIELENGRTVYGILYPRDLAEFNHPEITEFGCWRTYMETKQEA